MKTSKNISELQFLAASQWGLFSSAQAQSIGIGRTQISRMVSDGRIENLVFGIYRFTSGETTSFVDIKATWMSIFPTELAFDRLGKKQPDAIVAGRTAAYIHRLGDFYQTPYTFIVNNRKQTTRDDRKYLEWEIEDQDFKIIDGLPATTIERTIADLVRLKEDMSLVDNVVRDAILSNESIDAERLAYLLEPLASRNGYPRHDGETFARELIERNSNYQEEIVKSLESVRSLYANNSAIQTMIQEVSELASSAILKNLSFSAIDISSLVSGELGQQSKCRSHFVEAQEGKDIADGSSLSTNTDSDFGEATNPEHALTAPKQDYEK